MEQKKFQYIDLSYLQTMSNGNNNLIFEMIEIFREQLPELTAIMQNALKENDTLALSSAAHKAKSSITILGMHELVKKMTELEFNARNQTNSATYPELVDYFIVHTNNALTELDLVK